MLFRSLPFTLHYTNLFGLRCSCKARTCVGCLVPSDDTAIRFGQDYTIAVEWKENIQFSTHIEDVLTSPHLLKLQEMHKDASISLNDCLSLFSEEEVLSEKDMWYCPKCKNHVRATKKMDLWNSPDVLVG